MPELIHRYVPPKQIGLPTLLLLHGTGGNEDDLLPLGRMLLPGAALLSPRGAVLEGGMPRFFRRLAEGVFDLDDLRMRTAELARFISSAAGQYGFDPQQVVAVGYSNGANIAATLLLLYPDVLAGAVLFHAQVPIEPEQKPNLTGVAVLLTGGRFDTMIPALETQRLAALLNEAGARVTLEWEPGGHALTAHEVETARQWLVAWTPGIGE